MRVDDKALDFVTDATLPHGVPISRITATHGKADSHGGKRVGRPTGGEVQSGVLPHGRGTVLYRPHIRLHTEQCARRDAARV